MPAFYDGQQDYIQKLNEMAEAFRAGPFDSVPKTGGRMTGPLELDVALGVESGGTGANTPEGAAANLGLSAPSGVSLVGSAVWYASAVIGFDATKVPDGAAVIFRGRIAPEDGGGGIFTYIKTSAQTVDGGLVFAPIGGGRLFRAGWTVFGFHGDATVRMFGSKVDGEADDTSTNQAALNAMAGSVLHLGKGFSVSAGLVIPNRTTFKGESQKTSGLILTPGSNTDLITNAGLAGSGAVIEKMTLDGNLANNATGGTSIRFVTDAATDGPALVLRHVTLTGARGDAAGASSFVGGLCWAHLDNVRYVDNGGALWLSTNDSTIIALFVGNASLFKDVPGVIVGGSNNQFLGAYWGGNGDYVMNAQPQVRVWGGRANYFIGCINDHANGHGYEFADYEGSPASNNQIIGGQVTNPGQKEHGVYAHVVNRGNTRGTIISGVYLDNLPGVANQGAIGILDMENAGETVVAPCRFGTFTNKAYQLAATSKVAPGSTGLPTHITAPSGALANMDLNSVPEGAVLRTSSTSPLYGLVNARVGREITVVSMSGTATLENLPVQFLRGGVQAEIPENATLTLKCTELGVLREISRSF